MQRRIQRRCLLRQQRPALSACFFIPDITRAKYHVETQSALSLRFEHNHVHDANYRTYILVPAPIYISNLGNKPLIIFLYHIKISSSETSTGRSRLLSSSSPSESMTLYVGICGMSEGVTKVMSVVNLLLTAPGNRTLPDIQLAFL